VRASAAAVRPLSSLPPLLPLLLLLLFLLLPSAAER
jgi:hypothetical protein